MSRIASQHHLVSSKRLQILSALKDASSRMGKRVVRWKNFNDDVSLQQTRRNLHNEAFCMRGIIAKCQLKSTIYCVGGTENISLSHVSCLSLNYVLAVTTLCQSHINIHTSAISNVISCEIWKIKAFLRCCDAERRDSSFSNFHEKPTRQDRMSAEINPSLIVNRIFYMLNMRQRLIKRWKTSHRVTFRQRVSSEQNCVYMWRPN